IVLGCSVAVISSGIQSLGITLQRKSHLLHITINKSTRRSAPQHLHHRHQRYKRNMWLFGFMLFIVANILGSLIQITTLPLIILSPLQSIGLIFNSILSCLMLPGEVFTRKLAVGTVVIAVGAFSIAYNGNVPPLVDSDPPKDIAQRFDDVMAHLLLPAFMSWFIFTFVMVAILLGINWLYLTKKINQPNSINHTPIIPIVLGPNKYQFIKGINYGIISGTLTAHTFLFAKSIIDVIFESILQNTSSSFPLSNLTPYILLLTMLAIIGCQLTAFNLGLKQISTSILYPLCFLVYNLVNLVNDLNFNSLLIDHRMSIAQFAWIVVGLIAVLCGVVIISWDSAFGTAPPTELETINIEDEDLLYMKFPYTTASKVSTIPDEVLSYEQSQLLRSMDI
ncbi:predicted protein, partial [Scheffersomyces stipitis CBS 6054]